MELMSTIEAVAENCGKKNPMTMRGPISLSRELIIRYVTQNAEAKQKAFNPYQLQFF